MFAVMSAAALALVGGYSVSAQDYDKSGYCPITKGMTLEYVNYDADGARTGSFILKVSAVEGTLSKGTVTFDQYVGKVMKVQDIMSKGDASSVPAGMKVGTTIPDGCIKVKIGKISATLSTQNRQVTEQKSITVPAGTFDCFLIKEEQVTKTVMSKTERIETWYAAGIHQVRIVFSRQYEHDNL